MKKALRQMSNSAASDQAEPSWRARAAVARAMASAWREAMGESLP